jgi:RNA polymerase sigma factor (sigma-70 family)
VDQSDNQLLRRFVEIRDDAAFKQLVSRHLSMVYATALRRLNGNSNLAADISQEVFIAFSTKAPSLLRHTSLASWLYRSTCFAASKAIRNELRERSILSASAVLMNDHQNASEWERLEPQLDNMMSRLPEPDRHAVLLRFFENRTYRDVASELGVTEEAARKRVDRALDRLRGLFEAEGVQLSSGALGVTLASSLLIPPPAALAAVVCSSVAVGMPATTATIASFAMTKIQTSLVVLLVGAAVSTSIWQHRHNLRLKRELKDREQPVASALAGAPAVRQIRDRDWSFGPDTNRIELFRLRAEVTSLKRLLREMNDSTLSVAEIQAMRKRLGGVAFPIEQNPGTPFARNRYYPEGIWADVGLDSPEAVLQTALWAMKSGNIDRLGEALHWPNTITPEQKASVIERLKRQGLGPFPGSDSIGIRIENWGGTLGSELIQYSAWFDYGEGREAEHVAFFLKRTGDEWRLSPLIPVDGKIDDYSVPIDAKIFANEL